MAQSGAFCVVPHLRVHAELVAVALGGAEDDDPLIAAAPVHTNDVVDRARSAAMGGWGCGGSSLGVEVSRSLGGRRQVHKEKRKKKTHRTLSSYT